jgi:hypothetical protein
MSIATPAQRSIGFEFFMSPSPLASPLGSQCVAGFLCLDASTHHIASIRAWSSTGFRKKYHAPSCRAMFLVSESSRAETAITGISM